MRDRRAILTYLTGLGDLRDGESPPPAGTALLLWRIGPDVEARTVAGHRLGRLPPEERGTVAALLASGAPVDVRVAAVVPRPGPVPRARVHVEIAPLAAA